MSVFVVPGITYDYHTVQTTILWSQFHFFLFYKYYHDIIILHLSQMKKLDSYSRLRVHSFPTGLRVFHYDALPSPILSYC